MSKKKVAKKKVSKKKVAAKVETFVSPYEKERIVVLDAETTGFAYYGSDRMISLAFVVVENLEVTGEEYYWEFNPSPARSSAGALAVHGLTHAHLIKQKPFSKSFSQIAKVLKTSKILAGQNLSFDINFLDKEFTLHDAAYKGKIHSKNILDTMKLSRQLIPGNSHNLVAIAKNLGVEDNRDVHHALEDTKITADCLCRLLKMPKKDHTIIPYDEAKVRDEIRSDITKLPTKKERKVYMKFFS